MLDVASLAEPEGWFGFWSLFEAIHKESAKPRYTLNAIGGVLRQEFTALVEAFGRKLPETKKEIERRRLERLRALGVRDLQL